MYKVLKLWRLSSILIPIARWHDL